ncbi:BOLA class I histocompatibility antigen, alpha chain BL3-6-like [Trichomycterus rosablanca]|uniref:BOLA class I histocompatibility antigen, alpha chain BL3-6-like n=1 Tax=Trichomycterus rosablanca TaxID=2290929 RepID=UPI002F35966E
MVKRETHSLMYNYTAVKGPNTFKCTADGLVDGEPFVHYDSDNKTLIPKTWWIKNIVRDYPSYWDRETQKMDGDSADLKSYTEVLRYFEHRVTTVTDLNTLCVCVSAGSHTMQRTFGCKLYDNGTTSGFEWYHYNGEDFLRLNPTTKTWIAANAKANITKHKWELEGYNYERIEYLENQCIESLKQYIKIRRESLERKVRPKVFCFRENSSSTEMMCNATGFLPKEINITWQKDGEDVHKDVNISKPVTSSEGYFQRTSILRVSPEEIQKHNYTCVVQHSSLEKDLVLPLSDKESTGKGVADVAVPIAVVTAVVIAVVIFCIPKSCKRRYLRTPVASGVETNNRNDENETVV